MDIHYPNSDQCFSRMARSFSNAKTGVFNGAIFPKQIIYREVYAACKVMLDGRKSVGVFFVAMAMIIMSQSVWADQVILNDNFNDYSEITKSGNDQNNNSAQTNIFSNTNGIGDGFYVATWDGVIVETNSFISLNNINSGENRSAISSVDGMPISSGGSVFEFTNVQFGLVDPLGVTNTVGSGIDRTYVGVSGTNYLDISGGGWQSNPQAPGFYLQIGGSDVYSGGNAFNNDSTFFYVTASGQKIYLYDWTFDTLSFFNNGTSDFTPSLDIKITINGANWNLQITGDTANDPNTGIDQEPINFSGTYSSAGISAGDIVKGYAVAFTQSGVNMAIDGVIMKQLGNFIIGTPTIVTPGYPYNTNYVYAGEPVVLSGTASGVGTLSYQWQIQDPAGSGPWVNLPNATSLTYDLDTTSLGDGNQQAIQLVVSNNSGESTNSAAVTLTVAPATKPLVFTDTSISPDSTNYVGGAVTISAAFNGNHPIGYQWQSSVDDSTWNNIAGATNTTLALTDLQASDGQYYRLMATNAFGNTASDPEQLTVLTGGQQFVWSAPVPFLGLTADQILLTPAGELSGAAMFGNGPLTVSLGSDEPNFVFLSDNSIASTTGAGDGFSGAFGTNTTGNAAFNSVLGGFNPDGTPKTIIFYNLVVGKQYSVQLFALDDRTGIGSSRMVDFQDPNNAADISVPYETLNNNNSYLIGTFYASNTVESIQENLLAGGGNMNALVLRALGWNPPPYCASVPPNTVTYAGLDVSIPAAVGSYTTNLSYQWMAGPSGGPYTNIIAGSKYAGVTAATLVISNAAAADGSLVYLVTASNPDSDPDAAESVTSGPAELTVNTLSVTPMLIGEWLDGSEGFADESGFSTPHDGYVVGANYTWSTDVPSGSGRSLYFGINGANSDTLMVITNTSSTLDTAYDGDFDTSVEQNITVACWAKGWPPGAWNPWVSKGGENGIGYQMREDGSGPDADWCVRGPTVAANGGDLPSSVGSNDGKWHYYVGTFDGQNQTLYLDGAQVATQSATGQLSPDQPAPLVIGAKSQDGSGIASGSIVGGSYFTGGAIYDVRIYNYALTAGQVSQLYASYPPPVLPPTLNLTKSGSGLTLVWTGGILLQATDLTGPWTTNNSPSPFVVTPTGPRMFFKVLQQ
jgi:hypothetical protein